MGYTTEQDGCRLGYDVRGRGPGVLFLQGVGVHADGWRPQTDALSDRFACLTLDNRGVGRSRPAGADITVERMAADAAAVLDAAGWPAADVVGHSLGGPVALELALRYPDRVRGLELLCTFAGAKTAAPLTPRMVWLGARARVGTRRMRRRGFLRLLYPPAGYPSDPDATAAALAPLFGHDLGETPPAAGAQLRALRAYDATARLGELAGKRVLVLTAAHDPIAPPSAGRALAAGIPGSRYVEVPDASHGLPITHADRVNALLGEHLTG